MFIQFFKVLAKPIICHSCLVSKKVSTLVLNIFYFNCIFILFSLYFQMKQVKDYTIIDKIGKGGFAKVYTAIKGKQEEIYALKKIERNDENTERYIQGELEIVQERLKHRNIVQIFEYFRDGNIYIVLEYCEMGDLNAYLVQVKPDINQRIVFMTHMALGVNYLHNQNIIHRDLKPENVLITNKTGEIVCKITDFGVSRIKHSKHDVFHTYVGALPYMAPEITGDQEYGNEVDIFALGMLFYAVYKYSILTNSFGTQSLIPGLYIAGKRIAYLNEVMKREKPTVDQFIEKYFQDSNVGVGTFIFSMIDIKPENRPQMDFVLMEISEIKVKHELHPAMKDLQDQNDTLRTELQEMTWAHRGLIKQLQNQNYELKAELQGITFRHSSSIQGLQNQNDELRTELQEKTSEFSSSIRDLQDLNDELRTELQQMTLEHRGSNEDLQNQTDEFKKELLQMNRRQTEKNEANESKFGELYKIIEELQKQKSQSSYHRKETEEDSVRKKFNTNITTNMNKHLDGEVKFIYRHEIKF